MRRLQLLAAAIVAMLTAASASASPAEPSIWQRMVDHMRLVNDELPDTIHWARHYARHPGAFNEMLARSRPYLWFIVDAVEQRDMPAEIALLPAVESGFNPRARSQQHAQGLWQFVPWTSRGLGLQLGRNYDARRDAVASTQAALDYLNRLHDRFGDWYLSLAAYNIGATRLQHLMDRQPGVRDFWQLDLPRETREHVRRLMGIALLVEKPQRFSVQLPAIDDRPPTVMVALPGPVNLEHAARVASVSESTIREYNPGLANYSNTTSKKVVLLPKDDASKLSTALAQNRFPPVPIPRYVVHVVKPGDSLWKIAHRYQVKVRDIARHNGISARAVLRPGRRLEVPISS